MTLAHRSKTIREPPGVEEMTNQLQSLFANMGKGKRKNRKLKVKVAIRIPSDAPATYPIAITANTAQAELAAKYLAYVQSAAGQAVLARYGFLKP